MIVVDASAAVELLLATDAGSAIHARLEEDAGALFAPHLIDVEVAHALRRCARLGLLSEARARAALDDLVSLPVQRLPHDILLPRVWALRENVTAYDAVYMALAEALDATLITRDARLTDIPGVAARVELF